MRSCRLNIISYRKYMQSHVLDFMVFFSQNSILCAVLWLIICSLTSFIVELPVLDNEIYHAVKPGLSAYKDNPKEVCMPV